MYYVYVLKSVSTNIRYVGQTSDLNKRISAHISGDSRYTKNRGPWVLAHKESFATRSEAIIRERYLKTGKGREFLNNLER
jgi:putative endonuclease